LAKKKKIERPKRKPTKRQLSHWQKQKRRQRFILGIGISVIIAALGLVGAGIYYQWYVPQEKPLKETVIEVNDTRFDMAYYIDNLKYQLEGLSPELVSYYLDIIAEGIQQNELIRQEALELGITISDTEVKEEIKNGELPDNRAVRDIIRVQLLIQKLREGYFNEQVPVSAEQRHIIAMFLEGEGQVKEVRDRLDNGEDFGQLAGELSLDSYTKENNGDLGWRPEGIIDRLLQTSVLEEYVFSYTVGEVVAPVCDVEKTKELGYWLIEVIERNEETGEANVQAMMLPSEEEAQMIVSRLSGGEDFAELAGEYSQSWSEEDGADLGWLAEGEVSDAFSEFVFNPETELNTVSEPIRDEDISTKGGCWLFEVLDSGVREISDEDRDVLIEQAMQDWLGSLLEDPENIVLSYLNDEMREFAMSKFSES
jgi:parvulin-like peptidyl-prolyl isomerase